MAGLAWLGWHWPPARLALFLLLGLSWAQIQTQALLGHPLPATLTGLDLRLEGRLASLPELKGGGARFQFQVERAWRGQEALDFQGLVRLSWRDAPPLRVGEGRHLEVRLKPPHGFANPGVFDYERWLFQQGIVATGYVRDEVDPGPNDEGPGPYLIDRWRQELGERLMLFLEGSPARGLVLALVLGERSGISPEQWELLNRTGLNHLVAISGLHVGLVATSVYFLTRRLWSLSPWLVLRLAAPRAGALGGLAAALFYSALAGFAFSTQRALVMLAVLLVALLWARTPRLWTGLSLAWASVLFLEPMAALSYGFWLSFGAVAALLYGLGNRLGADSTWRRWGEAQWVVALGLLPLLFLLFGRASLISPLVNLVAVPLFSLVLLPMVLAAVMLALLAGIAVPLHWTAALLSWLLEALAEIGRWPWITLSLSGRPDWAWVTASGAVILLLAPRGLPGRWLGLPLLLPLWLLRPPPPLSGEAWFQLLDVGQGLSAVVRTADHVLVFDTGPAWAGGFNTGEAVVAPYLRELGIERIDTLILSHGDQDHTGGFASLAALMPIDRVLSGEPDKIADTGVSACLAGQTWHWDGVDFSILYPPAPGQAGNDSSCVLRVASAGASLLLTGDLGVKGERQLARATDLASSLLVAGHHGSKTSNSAQLLTAVAPRWLLYSSGFANHFGFPSTEVRQRATALGLQQLNTAEAGAIGFRLGWDGLAGPTLYRESQRWLWSWRAEGARPSVSVGGLGVSWPP